MTIGSVDRKSLLGRPTRLACYSRQRDLEAEPDQNEYLGCNRPMPTFRCHTHYGYGKDEEGEGSESYESSGHRARPT